MKKKNKHKVSNILFTGALIVGILIFWIWMADESIKIDKKLDLCNNCNEIGAYSAGYMTGLNDVKKVTCEDYEEAWKTTPYIASANCPLKVDHVYTFEKIANEIGQVPYSNEADSNGRTNINCVWHSNELIKRLNAAGYKAYEKTVNHATHMIVRLEVYIEANDGHIIEPEEYASYGLEGI